MEKTYLELVRRIRDGVRKKAQEIPKFRDEGNGAIRILAYPCCKEADDWFGGLSNFAREYGKYIDPTDTVKVGKDDIVDYEYTFAITAGGSRVMTGVWDGVEQKVDCYAYSALKIAHCSHTQDLGVGLISGIDLNDPYLTEDNGYGPHLGALCVEVTRGNTPLDFCGIYVCVSGADSRDDLKCAFVAVDIIKEFFASEADKFKFNIPEFPTE